MNQESLEIENLALRGELHDYEIALAKAHEIIAEARRILTVHAEEIACGVVELDDNHSIRHPLTQARLDEVKRIGELCEQFERLAPKSDEFPEIIGG